MSVGPPSGDPTVAVRGPIPYGHIVAYVLLAIGLAAVLLLLSRIFEVVLLAFGAVLGATLLRLIAHPIHRYTPLPHGLCLALAGALVLLAVAAALYLFGSEVSREFDTLTATVRKGYEEIEHRLDAGMIGRAILSQMHQAGGTVGPEARSALSSGVSAIEGIVVIVFTAAYFAAQPRLYRDGALLLFPRVRREQAAGAMDRIGQAVHLWLIGQLTEMAVIGALTALATWLIGLPSPLALGLIAAITEFVPYLGPIAAAVPALLVAVTQGWDVVAWTLGAYLAIHLFEGNILMPMLQRWLVQVPPALMLLGIAAFGVMFGLLGVILAAPAMVAIFTAIRKLYVEDALGEPPQPPGAGGKGGQDRPVRGDERAARRTSEPPRGFDRLLLAAHAAVTLLAAIVVADVLAGGHGRLMPWPRGGELAVSLGAVLVAGLLATVGRRLWRSTRAGAGRISGRRAKRPGRQGSAWHFRRNFGTMS